MSYGPSSPTPPLPVPSSSSGDEGGELVRVGQGHALFAGLPIGDRYVLDHRIGRGGMGEVWAARHVSLGQEVAIKLLPRQKTGRLDDSITAEDRFLREAQIAANLSRKTRHIVEVVDYGEENDLCYLVMELLEGETLEERIDDGGPLRPAEAVAIVTQVARALGLAHADGVLHRDLKSANVFLARDEDEALLVKLLDFGIARIRRPHRPASPLATAKGIIFGTPHFMSPEQASGASDLDTRCDVWALAVVAYEALTGNVPFVGETSGDVIWRILTNRSVPLRERRTDLPRALDAFFERAFAESIDARYQSASSLAEAFEQACGVRESPTPARVTPADPVRERGPVRERKRRRAPLAALASVVVITCVALAASNSFRCASVADAGASMAATPTPARHPVTPVAPWVEPAQALAATAAPVPTPTTPPPAVAARPAARAPTPPPPASSVDRSAIF
jgi:serine/threonine-protein kinase